LRARRAVVGRVVGLSDALSFAPASLKLFAEDVSHGVLSDWRSVTSRRLCVLGAADQVLAKSAGALVVYRAVMVHLRQTPFDAAQPQVP